jgi:hypothetical protein
MLLVSVRVKVDELMERKRKNNRAISSHILRETPRSYLPFKEQPIPEYLGELDENGDPIAIKARYDAQIIAHERTERKLEDVEKSLDKERDKSAQLRQELLKGLEIEKMKKERLQDEMTKMNDSFTKEELRYINQIQDLDLKITALENERLALLVLFLLA